MAHHTQLCALVSVTVFFDTIMWLCEWRAFLYYSTPNNRTIKPVLEEAKHREEERVSSQVNAAHSHVTANHETRLD